MMAEARSRHADDFPDVERGVGTVPRPAFITDQTVWYRETGCGVPRRPRAWQPGSSRSPAPTVLAGDAEAVRREAELQRPLPSLSTTEASPIPSTRSASSGALTASRRSEGLDQALARFHAPRGLGKQKPRAPPICSASAPLEIAASRACTPDAHLRRAAEKPVFGSCGSRRSCPCLLSTGPLPA